MAPTRPGTQAARTIAIVAGAFVAAAYGALIWSLDALPFQDLPNHLARAVVIDDLLLHDGRRFGALFTVTPVVAPYAGGDALLVALVELLGPYGGGRAWNAIAMLSVPIAVAAYLRVARFGWWSVAVASIASLYLATDWFFLSGFDHYRLAMSAAILALAAWQAWLHRGSGWSFVAWALLLAATYLFHLTGLVFVAPAAAVLALVALWFRTTSWRPVLVGGLPLIAVVARHLTSGNAVPGGARTWGGIDKFLKMASPYDRYGLPLELPLIALFAALVVLLVARGRASLHDERFTGAALLTLLFLALYLAMPFSSGLVFYIDVRAIPLAAIFALIAALAAAEAGGRQSPAPAWIALALAVANLATLGAHLVPQNRTMREYRALAAKVPANARVFTVATRPKEGRVNPYVHAGAFVTIEAGAVAPHLFTAGPTAYFKYRTLPKLPMDEWWYEDGVALGPNAGALIAAQFDHLLVTKPYDANRLPVRSTPVLQNDVADLREIER